MLHTALRPSQRRTNLGMRAAFAHTERYPAMVNVAFCARDTIIARAMRTSGITATTTTTPTIGWAV